MHYKTDNVQGHRKQSKAGGARSNPPRSFLPKPGWAISYASDALITF